MTNSIESSRLHFVLVPGLLVLTAVLAVTSLLTDSPTFDEPFHLAAGVSYLKTGDFRLSPDHPPLARLWAAWPLLLTDCRWPAADNEAWVKTDNATFAVHWLFELNDGQRLVVIGRCMMVILLLATCLTTYGLARTLCGPAAGLMALVLATLSPTLLAHGRLVTTDLPIALCNALVLLTFARLMRRITWPRLLVAALALTAASVTKFSWPLVLPALGVMAVVAIFGRRPIETAAGQPTAKDDGPHSGPYGPKSQTLLTRRRDRAALLLGCGLFIGLTMWAGIWTCYGWRTTIIAPPSVDQDTPEVQARIEQTVAMIAADWNRAFHSPDGTPRRGLLPTLLNVAADRRLLPDAYIFGLAKTLHFTGQRYAYLMGEYSDNGWRTYFPIAFAIKTPLATQLLLLAGIAAFVLRRARSRDDVLLIGLAVFATVYAIFMIRSQVNIGHRHLLPLYPVLFAIGGASAAWLTACVGRWLVGGALVWLLAATMWIHPNYLAYFNEIVGGPSRGFLYLADSNVDWGQDLLRLADYARRHPDQPIKLAYFGSAIPTRFVPCTALPSHFGFEPRAELSAGTYVVSATQLLGIYDPEIRDSFWADYGWAYRDLGRIASSIPSDDESPELRARRADAAREYADLRVKLLLNRLKVRPPDGRIGYSLLVYRLTGAEIEQLTGP